MTEQEQKELQEKAKHRFSLMKSRFSPQIHGVIHKKPPLTDADIEQLTTIVESDRLELQNTVFFGNSTIKNCTTNRKVLDLNTKKWRSYKY